MNTETDANTNQSNKIRLGAIAFINTLPIYQCLDEEHLPEVEITYGAPSLLNRSMANDWLDVSPVSSAYYLRNREKLVLLEDLSVSSPGSVDSVLFLSKVPLGEGLLDLPILSVPDASETSIALLAWLLHDTLNGKVTPEFIQQEWFRVYPAADYWHALEETGAILVIGDDALRITADGIPEGYYCYDLASLWVERTGLPFVFAVWVAQREWAEANPQELKALNQGLIESRDRFFADAALIEEGVRIAQTRCTISPEKLLSYFTCSLSYNLSDSHRLTLEKFGNILNKTLDNTLDKQDLALRDHQQVVDPALR